MVTQACTPKPLLDFVRGRRDLLDHPLLWTWKHLESLECQFDDLETSAYSESAPKDSQGTADADALGNLKSAVMLITWPMTHRKMIPYKPYDTFAGRLRDQLVASSPSKLFDHVNDATSYETKRRQGMDDDGEDDCVPRKIW
ncbi:uncharacterized protein BO72DRAFT_132959 [Aspergillus fijiensis CBS 313.89]|uniref:Uncharacterized protein n=1 Tax=Aspergillus fijiensis CBS 313.89 TaxID=1448319 RepID=A0A8G1VXN2_9EURO|nr:uncharacterized protein BO72DRAFT_132959 [Aspergillus fijiensis CBS 313.89]RAK76382.1 hypothetical protein BO72DRAFT_132959 [Aspergillus fijiensis CBS 313.89]